MKYAWKRRSKSLSSENVFAAENAIFLDDKGGTEKIKIKTKDDFVFMNLKT